jgi:hypothetical protein
VNLLAEGSVGGGDEKLGCRGSVSVRDRADGGGEGANGHGKEEGEEGGRG